MAAASAYCANCQMIEEISPPQAKAQAKADSKKTGKSDLKARGAALKITCDVCKSPMINYTQLKQHYESKHPKETLPPDPNA